MSKSVADFVASTMNSIVNSAEHKAFFGSTYKFASDNNCAKDHDHKEHCDSSDADDSDEDKDSHSDDDGVFSSSFEDKYPQAYKFLMEKFPNAAAELSALKFPLTHDTLADLEDEKKDLEERFPLTSHTLSEMGALAGYDVAIDSLITASAALDQVGMEKSASLSLKLASLVAEAKKKDSKDSKKSKDSKDSKSSKDKKSGKDKGKESKDKKDSKSSKDSKDSKKSTKK